MGQGCLPTRPRETVACGQHNPLAAADQVPRRDAPDLAYSNDCRGHGLHLLMRRLARNQVSRAHQIQVIQASRQPTGTPSAHGWSIEGGPLHSSRTRGNSVRLPWQPTYLTRSWRCALTKGVLTIGHVDQQVARLYSIRISGHLGPTAQSAFESTVSQLKDEDTLLTGVLDRSALYGVLAEIEALGLDLVELRRLDPRRIEGA